MRHSLPLIILNLLVIMGGIIIQSSVSASERPSSYHPRRLRISYRDRNTDRRHVLARRHSLGIKDILPVGKVQASWKTSLYEKEYPDPLWTKQWYAQAYRKEGEPVMDLNLVPVYRQGITGKGVTVAVVDNGIDGNHPDLKKNYWKEGSYDFKDNKQEVVLEKDVGLVERVMGISGHGTMCGGIIAMEAGNGYCGVGVAYDARIVGLKALGKGTTTKDLKAALTHKLDEIDIFSNSYGPPDDGEAMLRIDSQLEEGIKKGVKEGRGGKGSIYLVSSGNGGFWGDNCGADSTVNYNLTMAIAGASFRGKPLAYSEPCAAIFAAAYAKSIPVLNEGAVTVTPGTGCTTGFMGTSAACPIAAGMIALLLQANNKLTHRDVMHVVAMSSEVAPLAGSKGWYQNAAGFWVNNFFGFGMLNAGNMVEMARDWPIVPEIHTCVENGVPRSPNALTYSNPAIDTITTTGCAGTANEVKYLEQIEVEMNVAHTYRGAIEVFITSPSNTVTQLLKARKHDQYMKGLRAWTVKSVHNWGENPKGQWKVEVFIKLRHSKLNKIRNAAIQRMEVRMKEKCGGVALSCVDAVRLTMHGTAERPAYHGEKGVPRKYAEFQLRNDAIPKDEKMKQKKKRKEKTETDSETETETDSEAEMSGMETQSEDEAN